MCVCSRSVAQFHDISFKECAAPGRRSWNDGGRDKPIMAISRDAATIGIRPGTHCAGGSCTPFLFSVPPEFATCAPPESFSTGSPDSSFPPRHHYCKPSLLHQPPSLSQQRIATQRSATKDAFRWREAERALCLKSESFPTKAFSFPEQPKKAARSSAWVSPKGCPIAQTCQIH